MKAPDLEAICLKDCELKSPVGEIWRSTSRSLFFYRSPSLCTFVLCSLMWYTGQLAPLWATTASMYLLAYIWGPRLSRQSFWGPSSGWEPDWSETWGQNPSSGHPSRGSLHQPPFSLASWSMSSHGCGDASSHTRNCLLYPQSWCKFIQHAWECWVLAEQTSTLVKDGILSI